MEIGKLDAGQSASNDDEAIIFQLSRGGLMQAYRTRLLRFLRRFIADTSGAVAAIAAVALPVVIGIAALSLEYGHGLLIRVENQHTSDLASYAGAMAYSKTNGEEADKKIAAVNAGKNIAYLNGIDLDDVEITFSKNPEGHILVQADIVAARDLILARVLSDTSALDIRTRSVSRVGWPVLSNACILGLESTEVGLEISGNVTLDMPECAVASSGVMRLNGNVEVISACISPSEPEPKSNACSQGWTAGGPFNDPYSGFIKWPQDCDHGPGPLRAASGARADSVGGTLAGGTHCIDTSVDISGNYTLDANGPVTLVFNEIANLKLAGNLYVDLAAPTSGDMKGLLIHAPDSTIDITGTPDFYVAAGCEGIIGQQIKFAGTVDVDASCTPADLDELRERLSTIRLIR